MSKFRTSCGLVRHGAPYFFGYPAVRVSCVCCGYQRGPARARGGREGEEGIERVKTRAVHGDIKQSETFQSPVAMPWFELFKIYLLVTLNYNMFKSKKCCKFYKSIKGNIYGPRSHLGYICRPSFLLLLSF